MHKLAVNPSSYILYKLFVSVWTTGKVPNTWKEGIIVSLCKGKGQRNERSVYRPISILPVPRIFFGESSQYSAVKEDRNNMDLHQDVQ